MTKLRIYATKCLFVVQGVMSQAAVKLLTTSCTALLCAALGISVHGSAVRATPASKPPSLKDRSAALIAEAKHKDLSGIMPALDKQMAGFYTNNLFLGCGRGKETWLDHYSEYRGLVISPRNQGNAGLEYAFGELTETMAREIDRAPNLSGETRPNYGPAVNLCTL